MTTITIRFPARLTRALAIASVAATSAAAASECDLDYRITARPDLQPASIEVELRFAAAGRRQSVIRAQPSWAGVTDYAASLGDWQALGPGQSVDPMAEPYRWQLRHGPDDVVHLRWRARSALANPEATTPQDQRQLYRTQVGPRGFQFFGYGVLPSVEHWSDDTEPRLCVTVQPFDDSTAVFGSLGRAQPGRALHWRAKGSPARIRHAFYAGGPMWRLHERAVHGGTLAVAARGDFKQLKDAEFADASARLVDMQRRFWDAAASSVDAAPQWLVLTPNFMQGGNYGGTLVQNAAVLHVPTDFTTQSAAFESLVAHENLHQWIPQRFGGQGRSGPVAAAMHYWFSEGFTDHYTHRLLLASGLASLDQYAARLSERVRRYLTSPVVSLKSSEIAPRFFSDREAGQQMYVRGELLALRWDAALRRANRGSLTTLLQALMLPRSEPGAAEPALAAQRVIDALAQRLEGTNTDPRADLQRYVEQGQPMPLADAAWHDSMGPCLLRDTVDLPVWMLGFDRSSLTDRVLKGVDPQGPAHAAGLRDGMALAGFSIYGGDLERDALIQVREGGGSTPEVVRDVIYRPVARQLRRLPRWLARPDATADAACRAWISAR